MLKNLIRWFITLLGAVIGGVFGKSLFFDGWIFEFVQIGMSKEVMLGLCVVMSAIGAIIFYFIFPMITRWAQRLSANVEKSMEDIRLIDIALSAGGLLIGLLIAMLISFAFSLIPIPWIATLLSSVVYVILGYLGFIIPVKKRDDIVASFQISRKERESGSPKKSKKKNNADGKLLDTSVLIDGRINDICKAGFLDGDMIIPVYVINELQLIADSADDLKRTKGRRGLDMIKKMQTELEGRITILEEDYEEIHEVDAKLIKMAKAKKIKIITNDFNLNKVASVQGIGVLNINELAEAVKPVVLPGEEMKILPVKNGKELGQAVAYLDDGTMIVVENGRKYIGIVIDVIVTSILQTAAGRMIFAKPI